jgi:hypothetical protein
VRVQKFLGTPAYVAVEDTDVGTVRYQETLRDPHPQAYDPEPFQHGGRQFVRPPLLTTRGAIVFDVDAPTDLRLFIRHGGLLRHDFRQVHTLTGALHGVLPNEIRFVPRQIEGTWTLAMADLRNVYNDTPVEDGDLVLAELSRGTAVGRYLFRARRIGWRARTGAGVLVRVPVNEGSSVSPVFAASLALGYRIDSRRPTVRWLGDNLAVITSIGVGSTALQDEGVGLDSLDSLLNAVLLGSGIELYDMVSVQVFGNVSALFREAEESPTSLAVGFDAVQFGMATRDAVRRLFRRNALRSADVVRWGIGGPHAEPHPPHAGDHLGSPEQGREQP